MLLSAKVKPTKISLKYFKNTSKLNDFFVLNCAAVEQAAEAFN